MAGDALFDVVTPLGLRVHVSRAYWEVIVTVKHPVLQGHEHAVETTLSAPHEVRRSRTDQRVLLFYRSISPNRWLCAVAKRLNGDGFLITAYPTDTIKEGERVWMR